MLLVTTTSEAEPFDDPCERILQLIAGGEGQSLEFKLTFRYDLETGGANKALAKAVMKTIAGFMNRHGGSLLIGVKDEGTILGIDSDIRILPKKNEDGFEQSVRTAINNYLGPEISPLIGLEFIHFIENNVIAHIVVPQHHTPVFLKEGDAQLFYVRNGNRTDPLDMRAAFTYIDSHWDSQPLLTATDVRELIREALEGQMAVPTEIQAQREFLPPWLNVATRKVLRYVPPDTRGFRRLASYLYH